MTRGDLVFLCGPSPRPLPKDSYRCERCGLRVSTNREPRAAIDAGLGCVAAASLSTIVRTLDLLAAAAIETAAPLKAHVQLEHFLGERILEQAGQPEWAWLGKLRREVIPLDILDLERSDLATAEARGYQLAARLVQPGNRPWLVLIAPLADLRPPPPANPSKVLAWLGVGEGGVALVRPDTGEWTSVEDLQHWAREVTSRPSPSGSAS